MVDFCKTFIYLRHFDIERVSWSVDRVVLGNSDRKLENIYTGLSAGEFGKLLGYFLKPPLKEESNNDFVISLFSHRNV